MVVRRRVRGSRSADDDRRLGGRQMLRVCVSACLCVRLQGGGVDVRWGASMRCAMRAGLTTGSMRSIATTTVDGYSWW